MLRTKPSDITHLAGVSADYVLVYEVSKQDKASGAETDGQRRTHFIQEMEMLGINVEEVRIAN